MTRGRRATPAGGRSATTSLAPRLAALPLAVLLSYAPPAPAPLAPDRPTAGGATPAPGAARSRMAYFPDAQAFIDTPVLIESALRAGERHHGPALIEQTGSTVVIGPGDRFEIDEFASLRITLGARAGS